MRPRITKPFLIVVVLTAALLAAAFLTGCAGTSELLHRPTPDPATAPAPAPPVPATHVGQSYLQQLSAAQTRLTAAVSGIPRHPPRTPAQLARAVRVLAGAIVRLTSDLRGITPPVSVRRLHERLIAVAAAYAARLRQLAVRAAEPETEVAAANGIAAATETASSSFGATTAEIRLRLAK